MGYAKAWDAVGAEHTLEQVNAEVTALLDICNEGLATGGAAMVTASHEVAYRFHPGVAAMFSEDGSLDNVFIAEDVAASLPDTELGAVITDVIQQTADAVAAAYRAAVDALMPEGHLDVEKADVTTLPAFAEASRDGTVTLAVDAGGHLLWCAIRRSTGRDPITGLTLGRWITDLYHAAQMRALHDGYLRASDADHVPTGAGVPTAGSVARFRAEHLTF
jgi:hypothetical protein